LASAQKSLPTRYLYDLEGSEIFERITELPEYYLTRCETEIIEAHADEIIASCANLQSIIEFGSGSSKKTRLILEAALRASGTLTYVPIDISADFLRETAIDLLGHYPGLRIDAMAGEYFDAVDALPKCQGARLILFLGSNIGNLTRVEGVEFMRRISAQMNPADSLLMGIDLVKDPAIIEAAYNDAEGVTAAFNRNLLARINSELEGNFDISAFQHRAPYLPDQARVEMRLYSLVEQDVPIDGLDRAFHFDAGEFIHTEWSHKYTVESFAEMAAEASLGLDQAWFDAKGWFQLVSLRKHLE
jgi:L-histidine N-alpha-methyltransferase